MRSLEIQTVRSTQLDFFGNDEAAEESNGIWFWLKRHFAVGPSGLHYDLRIQCSPLKSKDAAAKSFPFWTNGNNKKSWSAKLVEDHRMQASRREGPIPQGVGEGAVIHFDEGYCFIEGYNNKTEIFKALAAGIGFGSFSMQFQGHRIKGTLQFLKTNSPDNRWIISRPDKMTLPDIDQFDHTFRDGQSIDFYIKQYYEAKAEMNRLNEDERRKYVAKIVGDGFKKFPWKPGSILPTDL